VKGGRTTRSDTGTRRRPTRGYPQLARGVTLALGVVRLKAIKISKSKLDSRGTQDCETNSLRVAIGVEFLEELGVVRLTPRSRIVVPHLVVADRGKRVSREGDRSTKTIRNGHSASSDSRHGHSTWSGS
jgi:hypothetical protein